MTRPLRSARITRHHRYYEPVRPCAPHQYSAPRSSRCLESSLSRPVGKNQPTERPPYRGDRFPRSMPEPEPSSRRLHAGHHLGSKQVSPRLIPGQVIVPRFRCHLYTFDTSSAVRFRSPSQLTPDALTGAPFPQHSPPRLLTDAACSGLRPLPAERSRRTYLHLWHSTASELRPSTSTPPLRSWRTSPVYQVDRAYRDGGAKCLPPTRFVPVASDRPSRRVGRTMGTRPPGIALGP